MENEIEILIMDPEASFNNRFMEDPEEMEAFLNDAFYFIRNHKLNSNCKKFKRVLKSISIPRDNINNNIQDEDEMICKQCNDTSIKRK